MKDALGLQIRHDLNLPDDLRSEITDYIRSYFIPGREICSTKWFNNNLSVECIGPDEYLIHEKNSGSYEIIYI